MEAQARQFHKLGALLAGRESLNPDNTIEGVVMLAKSSGPQLSSPDNGHARPPGQRPSGLFQSLLQRLAAKASAASREARFWNLVQKVTGYAALQPG
jgi:hypothetical protein